MTTVSNVKYISPVNLSLFSVINMAKIKIIALGLILTAKANSNNANKKHSFLNNRTK